MIFWMQFVECINLYYKSAYHFCLFTLFLILRIFIVGVYDFVKCSYFLFFQEFNPFTY
jgi:hypothetical protein